MLVVVGVFVRLVVAVAVNWLMYVGCWLLLMLVVFVVFGAGCWCCELVGVWWLLLLVVVGCVLLFVVLAGVVN